MNPTVYTVQKGDKFTTIRTCGGAVGAALGLYPEERKGVSWVQESELVTVINGKIRVTERRP